MLGRTVFVSWGFLFQISNILVAIRQGVVIESRFILILISAILVKGGHLYPYPERGAFLRVYSTVGTPRAVYVLL